MCERCGEGWRFETTVLGGPDGGRVKAVLHPISGEWEEAFSRPSTGSLLVATHDPSAEDIWAGATGLYISQVLPDGSRRCRFAGYVEKFNGVGGGATTLQLKSLDGFLFERLIAGPNDPYWLFINRKLTTPQTVRFEIWKPTLATPPAAGLPNHPPFAGQKITESAWTVGGTSALAAYLVRLAQGNIEGGPVVGLSELNATFQAPYTDIDLSTQETFANWWDFKNIGQAIQELVEAENGIKYRLDSTFTDGYWNTLMTFSDQIGTDRDYTILSDREAKDYGLEVNAEEKATRVYGVGAGDEGNTLFSIAYDADTTDNLPERQATQAWKDQAKPAVLDSLTRGYVSDHRDPVTLPSATLYGLPDYDPGAAEYDPQKGFPGPEILRPGDTFGVEIGYGVITVKDIRARALAVAWALQPGWTCQRTVGMQPVIRANTSVRTQTPAKVVSPVTAIPPVSKPPTADPWPTPGLVTKVNQGALTEISGMEYSLANPNHVWVFNDEKEDPQVYCIDLRNGLTYNTFTPNPGVSSSPNGDPESIRLGRVSRKLVLADTGDNDLDRPTSGSGQPHLLALPEPKGGGKKGNLAATKYPIAYPSGARHNCETLLIHPTTEEVFLVSKETSQARVFSFGVLSSMSTSNNVGTLVATLSDIHQVSDGCHLLAPGFVAFRSASETGTVIYKVTGSTWKRMGSIPTPSMRKSEAICAESKCAFLTTTEGASAPIYRVLIPTTYGATCTTPAGTGSGTGGPVGPITTPGQLLDLSQWKWQSPISAGDGKIMEVGPDRLTHGYERKPFFWLNSAVEGVVFEAPVNGATTQNSTNPRSELRQLFGNGDPASWSNKNESWQMYCELAFTTIPTSSDPTRGTVGMQLHDGNDDVTVLRLEHNGDLYVTNGDDSHYDLIDGSYVLGTWMGVRMVARKGGGIDWYRDNTHVATVPGVFVGGYFKAGAYTQGNETNSTGKGQTHIRKLQVKKLA